MLWIEADCATCNRFDTTITSGTVIVVGAGRRGLPVVGLSRFTFPAFGPSHVVLTIAALFLCLFMYSYV